jgi:hypothetical protein
MRDEAIFRQLFTAVDVRRGNERAGRTEFQVSHCA